MPKEQVLPPIATIKVNMSLEVGKPTQQVAIQKSIRETPVSPEDKRSPIEFFGLDLDGTTVDTMRQFEDINVETAIKHFGVYGLTESQARGVYKRDQSKVGREYIEAIAERYWFMAGDTITEDAALEVLEKCSKQTGEAFPLMVGVLSTLREKGIKLFVCTNATREDAWRKLEFANLDSFFDKDAVIGRDSGGPGRLKKGEPQLRKAAEAFKKDYDYFRAKAGYMGDTTKDVKEMIPCDLRLLIGVFDYATDRTEMIRAGSALPIDRFRVVNPQEYYHIISFVDMINAQQAQNT